MKWISVKDKLPGKCEDVLLFVNGEGYKTGCTVGHYAGARGIFYPADPESHVVYFSGITHWMPLPEPPEEETK